MTSPTAAANEPPDTIVFIHGLWMTPLSWGQWQEWFAAKGWNVIAPAWPGFDRPVAELNADHSVIKDVTAGQILDHYEAIIRGLDKPPVIIGHSFGGAFTQVLISRGLGAAGVPIHSAPVRGIRDLPLATLKSSFPVLGNPLNVRKAVPLNESQFKYAFGNTLSDADSKAAWEQFAVPAASKVLFQGAIANAYPGTPFKVDWKSEERAPLFLLGGGQDHVVPGKVSQHNASKYSGARVDFKLYEERSHFTVGEPGWEAVIDDVSSWIGDVVGGPGR
ncbi:MAG: alpha/beta hydrolase [Solirubrobacteraceae bacterium]|nr:alpha/beta hydrolase [Solirubrobacteraceae bacterium]